MRFKNKQSNSDIPTIDLIPMLNVMMSVLAFFVLVSMTLTTGPRGVKVDLPGDDKETDLSIDEPIKNLIVTLKSDDSFTINLINGDEQNIQTVEQLKMTVQDYLQNQDSGNVLLMADQTVPYKKVIDILVQLKEIQKNRISLAITAKKEEI